MSVGKNRKAEAKYKANHKRIKKQLENGQSLRKTHAVYNLLKRNVYIYKQLTSVPSPLEGYIYKNRTSVLEIKKIHFKAVDNCPAYEEKIIH
jgi:hypothetical protein